jgi:hypothetical protein
LANPIELVWTGPSKNTDDTDFTVDQYVGFELEIRRGSAVSAVSVPVGWSVDRQYTFPLADLSVGYGTSELRLRTVGIGGASVWTDPITVTLVAAPLPPTALAVR